MRKLLEAALLTAVSYAIMELWVAFRPPDLTDQLHAWLDTTHGRFEEYYLQRQKRGTDAPPLGE